jgi:hypothetical protein
VLFAAGLMNELSNLFVRTPEASDMAVVAVPTPHLRVDVPISVQRCNEFIAVACRAVRKLLRARDVESDAFKRMRKMRHQRFL